MKKLMNLFAIIISVSLLGACKSAPDSDEATTTEAKEDTTSAAGEMYKTDTEASTIEWIGTKVSGYHNGTVKIKSGELTVSNGAVTGGNFTLDMASIVATGPKADDKMNGKLTGHLKSPEFFDTEKFPEATFVITGVKPFLGTVAEADDPRQEKLSAYKVADPNYTVSGNLTLKGITKNIEFPARITMGDNTAEARAKFNIDRKQWDINYPGQKDDLVRDEIHLGILLKAGK